MRKRIVYTMLAGVMVLPMLSGCKGEREEIYQAIANLEKLEGYQITNVMQSPEGMMCYLEVVTENGSYTEYPVDEEGNLGGVAVEDINDTTQYALMDWIVDNKGYASLGESWYAYPDSYTKKLSERDTMYLGYIKDKLNGVSYVEDVTIDIGSGDETMSVYQATINSSVVKDILGINSFDVYKYLKDSTKDNNIKKICDYYMNDLGFSLVFSDGNLTLGVIDGVLRYMQLEVGGLGSRLYVTKCVVTDDITEREVPDFSSVVAYEESYKELAELVGKTGSVESALLELNNQQSEDEDIETSTDGEVLESNTTDGEVESEETTGEHMDGDTQGEVDQQETVGESE